MKNLIVLVVLVMGFSFSATAQEDKMADKKEMEDKKEMADKMDDKMMEAKTISLVQTKGEFDQKSLTLSAGTYIFEVANNGVGHDVGFVLAPKGKTDQANHIQEAYVTQVVATGEKQMSNKVTLEKGEYVYFCPMNPTPEYTLIVE